MLWCLNMVIFQYYGIIIRYHHYTIAPLQCLCKGYYTLLAGFVNPFGSLNSIWIIFSDPLVSDMFGKSININFFRGINMIKRVGFIVLSFLATQSIKAMQNVSQSFDVIRATSCVQNLECILFQGIYLLNQGLVLIRGAQL